LPDLVSDAVAEAHRYGCRLHSIALNSVPFDLEPIFTLRSEHSATVRRLVWRLRPTSESP